MRAAVAPKRTPILRLPGRGALYGTIKTIAIPENRDGTPMNIPPRFPLCTDKVRFVGDPVAFVVAETSVQAKDAAEAVMLEIDSLPSVTEAREAAKPGAPLVFEEVAGNVCLTSVSVTRRRSPRRLPRPRTSRVCASSAIALLCAPWSRAQHFKVPISQ